MKYVGTSVTSCNSALHKLQSMKNWGIYVEEKKLNIFITISKLIIMRDNGYSIIMDIIIVKHVVFASDAVHCEVHHRDAGTLSTGLRRLVKESKMERSNHHLRGGRHAYNKGIDK